MYEHVKRNCKRNILKTKLKSDSQFKVSPITRHLYPLKPSKTQWYSRSWYDDRIYMYKNVCLTMEVDDRIEGEIIKWLITVITKYSQQPIT